MTKFCIMGAYGGANVGDEVILVSLLRLLEARDDFEDVRVIGTVRAGYAAGVSSRPDYRHTTIHRPLSALRAAAGRHLIIGGGQMIDGSAGWRLAATQLALGVWVRLTGGRVDILGVGAYQVAGRITRALYSALFGLSRSVMLRDRDSLDKLSFANMGDKATVVADLVFSLADGRHDQKSRSAEVAIAIHGAPHVRFTEPDAIAMLAKRILQLTPGDKVSLALHDPRPGFDLEVADKIVAAIDDPRLQIKIFASPDDCVTYYSSVASVISHRMHPIIIGACRGAACLPLSGSPKMTEIARILGVSIETPESLMQLSEDDFKARVWPSQQPPRRELAVAAALGSAVREYAHSRI